MIRADTHFIIVNENHGVRALTKVLGKAEVWGQAILMHADVVENAPNVAYSLLNVSTLTSDDLQQVKLELNIPFD